MATKKVADMLSAYSGVDVFNAIRNSSPILQSRFPEATASNLKEIGMNLSMSDVQTRQEFIYGLLKMVSAVFVKNTTITNPLSALIKGGQYYAWGDLIENIKVRVAQAVDPKFLIDTRGTGKTIDPFVQKMPEYVTEFFQSNLPLQYLVTVDQWQLQKAFENAQGMGALISAILESINNAINVDLFQAGKEIFNKYINDTTHTLGEGQVMEVDAVTDEASGKSFILSVKNLINAMQFPTKAFNPSKLLQTSSSSTLTMYVRPEVMNNISVNTLAGAFNRDDLDLTPVDGSGRLRIKTLDNFGGIYPIKTSDQTKTELTPKYDSLGSVVGFVDANGADVAESDITYVDKNEDVIAVIASPDAFGMALKQQNYSPIYNPRGEYVNYWYNMEYWCYYSNLENVIIIKKKTS